jgi:hypothetical protein
MDGTHIGSKFTVQGTLPSTTCGSQIQQPPTISMMMTQTVTAMGSVV